MDDAMGRQTIEPVALAGHGRRLEYFTIAWNSLECLAGVVLGVLAGSVSLVGFGADSAIEVVSALALIWRMRDGTDGLAFGLTFAEFRSLASP